MATSTTNLHLTKPDITDPASPAPFNDNFDIIDAQIAELNAIKATVQGLVASLQSLGEDVSDFGDVLQLAKDYTDQQIGELATLLDQINGEVI